MKKNHVIAGSPRHHITTMASVACHAQSLAFDRAIKIGQVASAVFLSREDLLSYLKNISVLKRRAIASHFLAVLCVSFWTFSHLAVAGASVADQVPSDAYSVLEVYEIARERDPYLAMARYEVDAAEAGRDVARGKFFPQVSIFGDWSENKVRYESSRELPIPGQDYPGERYGLQLRSPIFNMRAFREYERQAFLASKSSSELAMAETELLGTLVGTVLRVFLAERDVAAYTSEQSALTQQLEEARALHRKSFVSITDVLEIQTRADSVMADLVSARGELALLKEELYQLTGIVGMALAPIASEFPLLRTLETAETAAQLAVQFDPGTEAARNLLDAARKAVEREKGSWWPEVDFVYTSQYSDVGFDNLSSPPRSSESYAISMRYPLFEGGAGSARRRGAWAEFYGAQQKLQATRQEVGGRARTAWVALDVATRRAKAARQAVQTAEVNRDATKQAVRAGAARLTDTLLALAQYTSAQRDLSEAQFQRLLAWLELRLVTGSDPALLAHEFSSLLHDS